MNKAIMNKDMNDKIKGLLVFAGLGDALGSYTEMRTQTAVYNGELQKARFFNRYNPDPKYTQLGQITDDTELMLILAQHLVKYGKYVKEPMVMNYLQWANHKTTWAMGRNTRDLFKGVKTYNGYKKRRLKATENHQSNGALMRSAILALLPENNALEDCKITNPNFVCINVNKIYLHMIRMAFNNKDKTIIINETLEIVKQIDHPDITKAFSDGVKNNQRDITFNKGWVVHGLYCAVYSLVNFTDYKSAIDSIINMGGDTDTNACIAGALLGAYYGFNQLYKLNKKQVDIVVACDTSLGDYHRPDEYTFKNIDNIIVQLTRKFYL